MSKARQIRSWMFVPGNREKFISKARSSAADCVLLDLEDGVLPSQKTEARAMVSAALGSSWDGGPLRYVRLNALSTPWFLDDLDQIVRPGLDGICITKVVRPQDVLHVSAQIDLLEHRHRIPPGTVRILAAIESAQGLVNAAAIAQIHSRLVGLMLGAEDYALDIGLGARRESEAAELIYARSAIVVAAASANILSIDGVFPDLDDAEGLMRDTVQARRLGFTCKSTFNPRQIELINTVFSPQSHEIEYARKVVKAFQEAEARGDASVAVGGQLVDRPILLRALRLLESIGG